MTASELESDVRRAWTVALETGGRVDERERIAFERNLDQIGFWSIGFHAEEPEVERDLAGGLPDNSATERGYGAGSAERIDLSRVLQPVDAAIEDSRHLTELPDDWDGDGSRGYSRAVWERATHFVRESAIRLLLNYGRRMEPPVFLPGSDGGIDVEWSVNDRNLIIRVPAEPDGKAEFYGNQPDCLALKGEVDLTCADSSWLVSWIAK
jgi:hypothetical protein